MASAEEISRHTNIDCVMWLIVVTLTRIYSAKEESCTKRNKKVEYGQRVKIIYSVAGPLCIRGNTIIHHNKNLVK